MALTSVGRSPKRVNSNRHFPVTRQQTDVTAAGTGTGEDSAATNGDGGAARAPAPLGIGETDADHCLHARAERAELEISLKHGVTFHDVARAWFGAHDRRLPPVDRTAFTQLFEQLLEAFVGRRGGVEDAYYCEHIPLAAALTDIDFAAQNRAGVQSGAGHEPWRSRVERASASAIHIEPLLGQPEDLESNRLLARCLDLHYRALEFLSSKHRRVCMRRIFRVVVWMFGTLDQRAYERDDDIKLTEIEIKNLDRELDEAEAYWSGHAQRRAQVRYVPGMMLGLALVAAVLAMVVGLTGAAASDVPVVALGAGALGAVVSVLLRLTKGSLALERESGTLLLIWLGSVRPWIGAVFGILVWVLIEGNLLQLQLVTAGDQTELTYAGLAFLAGFSERVAQTVLSTGDASLASKAAKHSGDGEVATTVAS